MMASPTVAMEVTGLSLEILADEGLRPEVAMQQFRDWVADVAGFVTGFALSFLVAPGGPTRVLRHLRQR